jgi:hypothetical protein
MMEGGIVYKGFAYSLLSKPLYKSNMQPPVAELAYYQSRPGNVSIYILRLTSLATLALEDRHSYTAPLVNIYVAEPTQPSCVDHPPSTCEILNYLYYFDKSGS